MGPIGLYPHIRNPVAQLTLKQEISHFNPYPWIGNDSIDDKTRDMVKRISENWETQQAFTDINFCFDALSMIIKIVGIGQEKQITSYTFPDGIPYQQGVFSLIRAVHDLIVEKHDFGQSVWWSQAIVPLIAMHSSIKDDTMRPHLIEVFGRFFGSMGQPPAPESNQSNLNEALYIYMLQQGPYEIDFGN